MEQFIGTVKLNLSYYHGQDHYSDGEIEDELLQIVKQTSDYTSFLSSDNRWPILYHLSPIRENLLEWFPFSETASLLEIGAGCGALTGLFCKKVAKVTAVELSKKRSEIIGYRHKSMNNLEIVVGNLNEIKFDGLFNYITLIGVLEYAGRFTKSEHPYLDFLKFIHTLLDENGQLLVAIENKLGLKYWAGYPEDHTGQLFEGIENYGEDKGVRTFSKKELSNILTEAGFDEMVYYYPFPDYKMPTQIFSDDFLPSIGVTNAAFPNYDQDRLVLFNERRVLDNIIQNQMFDNFSNSFLVVCKKKGWKP